MSMADTIIAFPGVSRSSRGEGDLARAPVRASDGAAAEEEELGGVVPIACAAIALSGIVGNALGDKVLNLFRITEPIAQGLGIGISSHGIGTARSLELGETQGAFSGLAIALTGVLTVIAAPFAAILPL